MTSNRTDYKVWLVTLQQVCRKLIINVNGLYSRMRQTHHCVLGCMIEVTWQQCSIECGVRVVTSVLCITALWVSVGDAVPLVL